MHELFAKALGIEEPIYIKNIDFNADRELHMYLDFRHGAKFECPICGAKNQEIYDTQEKCWRHMNFFQFKCYLHYRTPRVNCDGCGVHLWTPPWARSGSGFTTLFELMVMTLAKSMPVKEMAGIMDEHDTRLWRIIKAYVCEAYEKKDFSESTFLGVDETSSKKGHNYVTVFADAITGDVLYATEGKGADTVKAFAEELPKHNAIPEQVEEITMDMSPSFISGVSNNLPNAEITFDKFHVIKNLNEALDEVRRQEVKENELLKGTRYFWLKNPINLTPKQAEELKTLSKQNSKTAKVYQMKLTLQDIYRYSPNPIQASVSIRKWLSWAVRSRIEPVKGFAKMVKRHYTGILRYFESGLTSGVMEGINSRIQEIKRRAKGYRNIDNFIAMIYLVSGNLDIPSLNI